MGLQDDMNATGDIISLESTEVDDICPLLIGRVMVNANCIYQKCHMWVNGCSIANISAALGEVSIMLQLICRKYTGKP